MNPVNKITFYRKDFVDDLTFYGKIALQTQLLLETGNEVLTNMYDKEDPEKFCIELQFSAFAVDIPEPKAVWLTPLEITAAAIYHNRVQLHDMQDDIELIRASDGVLKKSLAIAEENAWGDVDADPEVDIEEDDEKKEDA